MIEIFRYEQRQFFIQSLAAFSILVSPALVENYFSNTIKHHRSIWMKPRNHDFWERIVAIHFTDNDFLESFRMRKDTFFSLCESLRVHLEPQPVLLKSREPVSVEKQIAVTLYKLASCAEYRVVGNVFGIHKSTVKKCFYKVVNAINNNLLKTYIFMPNQIEAIEISEAFHAISKIPQIVGCIDGTHIPILPPSNGFRDYVNRKGWASYNMQAVVDNRCRFRDIYVKYPGNTNDAYVFRTSTLYQQSNMILPRGSKNINGMEIPYFILGDPAYPLLSWLLKGYTGAVSPEKESFNVYLNSARVSVEMAFGRLKARWRILLKRIDIHYKFVPNIVSACCILHNFVENNKEQFLNKWLEDVQRAEILFPQPNYAAFRERDELSGSVLRDHLCNYLAENYPLRRSFIN